MATRVSSSPRSAPTSLNRDVRTRADIQALVEQLVTPLLPHFSAARAQVRLGPGHAWYGEPGDLLEGFSRPLWGLAPLLAGGGSFDMSLWREGIAAGTDPDHPEFWGWPGDFDQRIVEMAPMALALILAPHEMWTPLAPAVRARFGAWLERVNAVRPVESNWLFFRVLVNLALRRCGQAWSRANLDGDLAQLDTFHIADGWYSDGHTGPALRDGRVGDYYVPMGMHFYGLLYAVLEAENDHARVACYVSRARRFAADFVHWFAADGTALPFGRSLTYRFAQGSFWGALAYAGVEALPWAVVKGLYMRHLRAWLRQPIFSDGGLLTVGYTYPNIIPAETYNGPGSPYWALKTFLPLALPDDHPFWQAEEAPLPPRRSIHTVGPAKLVLVTSRDAAADVVALNPGQAVEDWPRHAPHKYSKFAYSSRFGFSVATGAPTLAEGGFDSMLALSDDERRFRHRDHCVDAEVREGVAFSRWRPWPDVTVETWLIADETCHVRVHRVTSERRLWSAEGGFAVGYARRDTLHREAAANRLEVRTTCGRSGIVELYGDRAPELIELGANSHLLFPLSAMPVLRAAHTPGQFWLACVAYGQAPREPTAPEVPLPEFAAQCGREKCTIFRHGDLWWQTARAEENQAEPRLDFTRDLVH